ncbi:MAG: carbamoylphosphate synthase large subunit [bacterium]
MSAPKTVLLTGGRAAATLELARMLKGRGVRVIMAEHIGWHLSRFSRAIHRHYRVPWPTRDLEGFISALEAIIQAEAVDLVIPTCEEIFHIARRRARLAARCAVYAADLDALVRLHHKGRFIDAARRAGLAVPATTVCTDADSLRAALRGPVVLKPAWSRFAARTILLPEGHRGEPLPTPSPADPWLVQQLIPGRVLCTWGLCHAGRLVAYAAYETRFTLGLGASASVEMLDHPALEAWMARLVEEESFTGQLGLDLIEAADGTLYGIEANPRVTSGLHLFAHDPRLLDRFWTPDAPRLKPVGGRPAMLGISMLLALRRQRTRRDRAAWWDGSGRSGRSWDRAIPSPRSGGSSGWPAWSSLRGRRAGRPRRRHRHRHGVQRRT